MMYLDVSHSFGELDHVFFFFFFLCILDVSFLLIGFIYHVISVPVFIYYQYLLSGGYSVNCNSCVLAAAAAEL